MMIPVLVVEGKPKKVIDINFRDGKPKNVTTHENGFYKTYFDESNEFYVEKSLKVNLKDSLYWQGRYDEPYEAINSLIEDNQKELIDLSTQIADASIENTFVPPSLIEQYKKLKQRTFGLMDAQDILHEVMMVEDVDLSGGEDID